MTVEQILALRPGDVLVAHELDTLPDSEGLPNAIKVVTTTGYWTEMAINYLRERNGLPPLPEEDEDDDA